MKSSELFKSIAHLSETLDAMMDDLGLIDVSASEKTVLAAMSAVATECNDRILVSNTEAARQHPLGRRLSQATFHRALRKLVASGYVRKAKNGPAGQYLLLIPEEPKGAKIKP